MNIISNHQEIITMILIFFARITDVSLGTMRIILISRGYRYVAPLIGFVEILIWLMAITEVMKNLNSMTSYLIFAAGFATGNYVGMLIESKIAIGYQSIRIITTEKMMLLPMVLRDQGFGVTTVKAQGAKGEVMIIFTVVPRRKTSEVLETVLTLEPKAFVSIEDVKSRYSGFFVKNSGIYETFGRLIGKKR